MRIRLALISIVLCWSPAFAWNSDDDSTKTFTTEPVVVTGTQSGMLLKFVPASISLVTTKELEESGRMSLLDVVSERIPGVFVTQRGVIGFGINNPAGTITIRGIGGSPNTQVLVMIDGVPQFMGLFGHPFPDTYLSGDAGRVEVVRGPASVLYGTNAMGGVINIITKREVEKGLRFTGESSYGTFKTQEYSAGIGCSAGKFDILLSGNHDQTAGHRAYSGYNVSNGYINGGGEFSDNLNLRLSGNINEFMTYDPGPASSPKIDNWVNVLRSTGSVSIDNKFRNVDGSVRLFYNYGGHDVFDGFHSIDRNLGAVLYENLRLREGNVSTVGVDYQHYGGAAVNNIFHTDFGSHFTEEIGLYAMVQQLVMNTIMLNVGARFQHSSVYGNEFVPQGGIAWGVTSSATIKASISKGFRSPSRWKP
ncbi:MAG: TonB-dependent receptor [Bacteroidetes bacterium]|nr:TonB-dependent receptor [Bacteroidota bacterium]